MNFFESKLIQASIRDFHELPGVMDKKPFLQLDMQNFQPTLAGELKRLAKPVFNVDEFIDMAITLKYVGGIKGLLKKQLTEPDEAFVKFFFDTLCPDNRFRGSLRDNFIALTPRSFREFIREQIDSLLDEVSEIQVNKNIAPSVESPIVNDEEIGGERIITTEEELEGFYIVKALLNGVLSPNKITYRDYINYFNVLFDGRSQKPICRFYFNNPSSKKIGLFDKGGGNTAEEKISINNVNEIFQYADRIRSTVPFYLEKTE